MHQFRFHRSFIRSLKNLDSQSVGIIYKTIHSLQDKPDFNTNSIRLEKLHHNDFYSIRASKGLRIILVKLKDEVSDFWLFIYAGKHDDAYNWALDRKLEFSPKTQTFDITYVEGKELPPEGFTLQKPNTLINKLTKEQLLELGVKHKYMFKVVAVRTHDDIEQLRDYMPDLTADALGFIMLGESYDEVLKWVKEGQVDAREEEVGKILDSYNNKQNLAPIQQKSDLDRFFSGDFEEWTVFLHPSQRKLVDKDFKGPVLLTGGAGTGKTIVALHRAKRLAEASMQRRPILFSTASKSLATNLEGHFKALGLNTSKVKLESISNVILLLAKQYALLHPSQKVIGVHPETDENRLWQEIGKLSWNIYPWEFLKEEYLEVIIPFDIRTEEAYLKVSRKARPRLQGNERSRVFRLIERFREKLSRRSWVHPAEITNELSSFLESGGANKPFSHVLIDEVQDLGMAEIRLVRALAEEGENDLFLCGDPQQKTGKKKLNFSRAGVKIKGRSFQLRINYRTTEQIRLAAFKVLLGEKFEDFEEENYEFEGYYSLLQGEKPLYRLFKNPQEELDFVLKEIKELRERGMDFREICVGAFRNAELKEIKKTLHKNGIPHFEIEANRGDREGVRISSFYGVKGMEFRTVILTGLCEEKLPHRSQGFNLMGEHKLRETIRQQKAALYVSMSRARDQLLLTGTAQPSNWIDPGAMRR
ncbi:MAG: AAA family ATPase [Bacteroidia bacterium]|nr:AAA family ATPase [Bacteroidia bacterium]